jgi:hypothetical protein
MESEVNTLAATDPRRLFPKRWQIAGFYSFFIRSIASRADARLPSAIPWRRRSPVCANIAAVLQLPQRPAHLQFAGKLTEQLFASSAAFSLSPKLRYPCWAASNASGSQIIAIL